MFRDITYLLNGNERQRQAFRAISSLEIMSDLVNYRPILCGTIPIQINIDSSDLDIILEGYDLEEIEERLLQLYNHHREFVLKRIQIRNQPVVKANFIYENFAFEVFAQEKPTVQQNAYLHMVTEYHILQQQPALKQEIIRLKESGMKTEPAFCHVLGLEGDPYEALLEYGIKIFNIEG